MSDPSAAPMCLLSTSTEPVVCDGGCGLAACPKATAASGDEFLRGHRVMQESGAPPLGVDYWYRCGACGSISPANRWPAQDDTLSCPVCQFIHTDTDDDPGVEDGTFEELHVRSGRTISGHIEFVGSKRPPQVIEIRFCPSCGRTNRNGDILRDNHYSGGLRCSGTPVAVLYEVEAPWRN